MTALRKQMELQGTEPAKALERLSLFYSEAGRKLAPVPRQKPGERVS